MKTDEIRDLIKLVEESNIDEIEVSRWWRKVRIRKKLNSSNNSHSSSISEADLNKLKINSDRIEITEEALPLVPQVDEKLFDVKSPMVGTFYRAPAPDADPYVKEGDYVKKGQILCIIEAMKLMNEIEAEKDGKIVKIIPQNSQPVEYNQAIFNMREE
ncbi:acetyl-CoA carboxylase biotin carboxyl carrier protein [bacterium]|nr:acetyl-CoA carboxylase biotin carboxyl carrier protein [bacterium]